MHFDLLPLIDPSVPNQSGAEVFVAAYEALAPILRALVSTFSPLDLDPIRENDKSSSSAEGKAWLDPLLLSFLQNINNLLAVGVLVRTRRAVLLNWKVINMILFFHFQIVIGT